MQGNYVFPLFFGRSMHIWLLSMPTLTELSVSHMQHVSFPWLGQFTSLLIGILASPKALLLVVH